MEEIRYRAACGLAQMGPLAASPKVVSALAKALEDKSARVRGKTAEAISQLARGYRYYLQDPFEDAIPQLVQALNDEDPENRTRAAVALGMIGKHTEIVVPALLETLKDRTQPKGAQHLPPRESAILALGQFGRKAKAAVPALVEELKSADLLSARLIISSLGQIKSDIPTIVPLFRKILADGGKVRLWDTTAKALGVIGPQAKEAIPDLVNVLTTRGVTDDIRQMALFALGQMKEHSNKQVPLIIGVAKDGKLSPAVRRSAVFCLGEIGPGAWKAIPFLVQCLNNKEFDAAQVSISHALKGIGKEAVPHLVSNLVGEKQIRNRVKTIQALEFFGPLAKEALPVLQQQLENPDLRRFALHAISRIEGKPK